ncbi:hypothetical protein Taro_003925 [Colocasia esculenta]|uniref:Uncharacterized protein n=1 Tax=Colocasia esculenta TaxID=4460 RepID=A0A843TTB0_COLES|nr:hypothetical protein [Colocasia esculenta]
MHSGIENLSSVLGCLCVSVDRCFTGWFFEGERMQQQQPMEEEEASLLCFVSTPKTSPTPLFAIFGNHLWEMKESRRVPVPLLVPVGTVVESGLRHQQSNIPSR